MTPEEAILRIKAHMEVHKLREPQAAYITEALNMAMTTLKEIQQYREIGTVEECREAVEKRKPKKVKIKAWSPARCPSCDYELSTNVGDGYYKHPIFLERCPQCGQKLDWSEEE